MRTFRSLATGVAMALASATVTAQVDCNRTFEPSDQAMPAEYAICAPQSLPFGNQPLAPTDTAFVNNLFAGGSSPPPIGIHSHVLNNFPASLTFRGATNAALFSMDFSPDGSILWGAIVSNAATPPANNRTIGQINQTTGAYTSSATLTGFADQANENASDLAINPSTGEAFLFTNAGTTAGAITVRTYRVNLTTGALTLVGAATAQPSFLIDAAINCQGEIFGHQFGGGTIPSNLVRINPTNGAITVVGPTGFVANFAQGMDFDADTGTLYMYHFQATSAADAILRYGTVNLATGALTPIFSTAPGSGIELEGAVRSSCPIPTTPPVFGYTPAPSSTVTATGGSGLIGSTSNLSIAVSVATPGVGTGAPATTTLTCTAPTAPFAGFGQTVTAIGDGAISGGPLAGTCTRGATAVTQTLTCTENQGGTNVTRTWTLNCPAGTPVAALVPVNATSTWSLIALMLALLGFAAVAVRRQG
jgi:hypothetical protein